MSLKAVVDKLDEVAEPYRSLYVERDGKHELAVEIGGVEGVKSYSDFVKINGALRKERDDHKSVKTRLSLLGDRKIEDVIAALDRIPELEALVAAGGKPDENKLNELVEARLKTKLGPVERELLQARTQLSEREKIIEGFTLKERTRAIHDAIRSAATTAKLLPEALEDAIILGERMFEVSDDGRVVTKDNVGVTPGVEASVWLTDMQQKRPHWWGVSVGGGANGNRGGGGGGANPWSAESWNMTEQSRIYSTDRARAEQLAKAAGTTIGGAKPQPRK